MGLSPDILTIVTGTSSLLGLLSLIVYVSYRYRVRALENSERSVKEIVEGEGLFNADQILQILKEFKDDETRLNALKAFAHISDNSAERVYGRIKGSIDIESLETTKARSTRKISLGLGLLFLLIALVGLAYTIFGDQSSPPAPLRAQFHRHLLLHRRPTLTASCSMRSPRRSASSLPASSKRTAE